MKSRTVLFTAVLLLALLLPARAQAPNALCRFSLSRFCAPPMIWTRSMSFDSSWLPETRIQPTRLASSIQQGPIWLYV